MVLKLHWLSLMCHNGAPHLVHGVTATASKAKQDACIARDRLKDSLRRNALAAKALDQRLTRLYVLRVPEADAMALIEHHRRYMNG
jgi:hypothetical protein